MSDEVNSNRKLKSYRTERHLLIRRLETSQQELNSFPNKDIDTRRKQELKNFIILGKVRLKELELNIIEQEKIIRENSDINILESSFKELTMIPRTPPNKPAAKADDNNAEPNLPDKLPDIIDNTPKDNPPDILVSTTTETTTVGAVGNPVADEHKKKKSSLDNVSNIPMTIPEEPTQMATGNKITSTPQYKPLYSDDGSRIHADRPSKSNVNENETVIPTEKYTGTIKKTVKKQMIDDSQQATITDVSDDDRASHARKITDSIELRQRHMNRQKYRNDIATESSSDEPAAQEKQQIVVESQKTKTRQSLKRPVSFNLPVKEIPKEREQTELNVTYDIINDTLQQAQAQEQPIQKARQSVQQPQTFQQMGGYNQTIPLDQTVPIVPGAQVNQQMIRPTQAVPWNNQMTQPAASWNQQMVYPFQMLPWSQQGIQTNQMLYPNQMIQPNQLTQANQAFPQHMMSAGQMMLNQTIPEEHQQVQQARSEQSLYANRCTLDANNSMNQSQLQGNQTNVQSNQQQGRQSNDASAMNQSGEWERVNISDSTQNQQRNAQQNASNRTQSNATRRQNLNDDDDEPRVIFLKRLNNIPEFNEESFEHLKKFLEKAETLYYQATNTAEDKEWLQHILIRVNSEARNVICSLDERNWDNYYE